MQEIQLTNLPERAQSWKKANKQFLKRLKSRKDLSVVMQKTHQEVFSEVDCLNCANCCKTTGPLFTDRDIERIARHFKMSFQEFVGQYLRRDEDDDLVLKELPCPFLEFDHKCQIYDIRPKACRQYPHTDANNQNRIFSLTLKNAEICPAVWEILERINTNLQNLKV